MKSSKKIASTLMVIGVTVVGLAGAQQQLSVPFPGIPASAYPIAAGVGVVLLGAGLALWLWFSVPAPLSTTFEPQRATAERLAQLREFAAEVIDANLMTVPRLQAWQALQPECHQLVYRIRRGPFREARELVGFFSVVAINSEAAHALSQPSLNGFRVEPRHLATRSGDAAALYVAAIGARGFRARGRTVAALSGFLAAHVDVVPLVLTRPVTSEGVRLARQHHFVAVTKNGDLQETIFARRYGATAS